MKSSEGNQNIIIKEYDDVYRDKVKDFLIEVAIKEFGFEEWNDYFNKAKFLDMKINKEKFWIALNEDDIIVGTIGISEAMHENAAKLHSLYVRKEYRKKGLATKLYNCSLNFSKDCGYNIIILHTYTIFQDAISFYKKNGFKLYLNIDSKDGIWYYKNIQKESEYKWNDYFSNIRNKYNMRVSLNKPLIINLDGKGITRSTRFSLIDNTNLNSFLNIMENTVKYFTRKYNCLSIFGTDEVSFIFENPRLLISDLNSDMNKRTDEIISMFSQYFFDYFNKENYNEKVFWHGECFSIPYGKVTSYVKYKSGSIKNVLTTYFLKKNNVKNAGRIRLDKKIEQCEKFDYYRRVVKKIEKGILYFNGEKIDLEEYLEGNIKVVNKAEKIKVDSFFDLSKWDLED